MSTTAESMQDTAQMDAWLDKKLDELLPKKLEEIDAQRTPSMSIIATKGTLDWAYPPFILASTAAALGCFMLITSTASSAWSFDDNYDSQSVGSNCGSFWVSPYEDSTVSADMGSSGTKSCKFRAYQGNTGWGGGIDFPGTLRKGDEFWMRFRLFMPSNFDYGVYSSGDKLKFVGIDTQDSSGTPSIWYWEWTRENGGEPPYGAIMSNDNCTSYSDCWQFFGASAEKCALIMVASGP